MAEYPKNSCLESDYMSLPLVLNLPKPQASHLQSREINSMFLTCFCEDLIGQHRIKIKDSGNSLAWPLISCEALGKLLQFSMLQAPL